MALLNELSSLRLSVSTEKEAQREIELFLATQQLSFSREYRLDANSIIDFYFDETGTGLEVKIGGTKKQIFRQCERYASFPGIKQLVVLTNQSIVLPRELHGKLCHVISMGMAWL